MNCVFVRALTGLLMDLLIGTVNSRVVTVSSGAHP